MTRIVHTSSIAAILNADQPDKASLTTLSHPSCRRICSRTLLDSKEGDEATQQCPLDAVACCSRCLLTCALLMTSSHSEVHTEADFNTWSNVGNGDAYGYAKVTAEKMVTEYAAKSVRRRGPALTTFSPTPPARALALPPSLSPPLSPSPPLSLSPSLTHKEQRS